MMNNKLFKTLEYTLITILAIFCFANKVSAVDGAQRLDGENGVASAGSLADDKDDIKNIPQSGTIVTPVGSLGGTSCSSFTVSFGENLSQKMNSKKGTSFMGPFIENQGNIMYTIAGTGEGCASSYTGFCLDPQFDGVRRAEGSLQYQAAQIDSTTLFGKRIYALYTLAQGQNLSDPQTYFAFQVAARIIAFQDDSDYQSRANTFNGRGNARAAAYKNNAAGLTGWSVAQGRDLAAKAIAQANSLTGDATETTYGITMNQIGSVNSNGELRFNVNVQCTTTECNVDPSWISISGVSAELEGAGVAQGNTVSFTYVIRGLSFDTCQNLEATAVLNVPGGNKMRKAMELSPVSKTKDDRQHYIVFAEGGDGVPVTAKLPISTCPDTPPPNPVDDSCKPLAALYCDGDDESFAVVNEGDTGGGQTNWESCIFGKTDAQGNSYDIVSDISYLRTQNKEQKEEVDESEIKGDRSDIILGYTYDNSGGTTDIYGGKKSINDSKYCTISCKEKYAFILPGNKSKVKQGTYFSFQVDHNKNTHAVVGISAERLCVSTGPQTSSSTSFDGGAIKTGLFNSRVKDLRKQQIDFYNMYTYYRALYNAMNTKLASYEYRKTNRLPECNNDPTEAKIKYKENREKSCAYYLQQDKYRYHRWVPSWNGGGIEFKFNYYTIDGDNLSSSGLHKQEKEATLGQSFQDVIKPNELNVGTGYGSGFDFYNKYYKDYSIAWSHHMSVAEYSSPIAHENYQHSGYMTREVNEECVASGKSEEECAEYKDPIDETKNYDIKYLDDSRPHGPEEGNRDWTEEERKVSSTSFVYDEYKKAMENVESAFNRALAKYNAINAQIGVQSDAMQECTNYLKQIETNSSINYKFNPVTTFSYEEEQYMNMLKPNTLVNMHDGEIKANYELFFGEGSPSDLFNGGGGEGEQVEFKFGDLLQDEAGDTWSTEPPTVAPLNESKYTKYKEDTTAYYNVTMVGSRATYGRYTHTGGENCSRGYINGKGDRDSYCYEFYQSGKQFYAGPPDGLATTNPGENSTILSTDGRVYPVAINTRAKTYQFEVRFSNIGQFNETGSLGRIMGGGDGKQGTMQGKLKDTEVCNYKVCRVDDRTCSNKLCYNTKKHKQYYESDCNENEATDACIERLCPDNVDVPICYNEEKKKQYYEKDCRRNENREDCIERLCPGKLCYNDEKKKQYYKKDCKENESEEICRKRLCPGDGCLKKINSTLCNYGDLSSAQKFDDASYQKCLYALMHVDKNNPKLCCDQVTDILKSRNSGKYVNTIPEKIWDDYHTHCLNIVDDACTSFTLITYEDASATENLSDKSNVNNDGSLQVNARAVSLNNVFPNSGTGVNWETPEAKAALIEIEQIGDGIFNQKPEYKITIDSKCADRIKEYNARQSGIDKNGPVSDYNSGGFNDYTNKVKNATTKEITTEEVEKHEHGTDVAMSEDYYNFIKSACSTEGFEAAIDLDVDNSSLVLEPWQYNSWEN